MNASTIQFGPLILNLINSLFKTEMNTALFNLYSSGTSSIGWHSDDEDELGVDPMIISLSLGAARTFLMRNVANKNRQKSITLESGSIIIMAGKTQQFFQHKIPCEVVTGARINITFRQIL